MGSYDGVARGRGCPDQLMDAITLTSGQRPLLAGRRARYLERYSSRGRCDGETTYRCAVSLSASTSSARGDELALILAGPLPQSKRRWCRGATSELVARPDRSPDDDGVVRCADRARGRAVRPTERVARGRVPSARRAAAPTRTPRRRRDELLLANLEVDRVLGPPPRDDEGRLLLGRPPCHGRCCFARFRWT